MKGGERSGLRGWRVSSATRYISIIANNNTTHSTDPESDTRNLVKYEGLQKLCSIAPKQQVTDPRLKHPRSTNTQPMVTVTMETKTNPDICGNCGESRNPKTARFEHRRIGLDEPPGPVLCRCRDPTELFEAMKRKIALTTEHIKTLDNTTMLLLPSTNPNMVMVDSIAKIPVREVEIGLDVHLAKVMFERMESGLFTNATVKEVREIGTVYLNLMTLAEVRLGKRQLSL